MARETFAQFQARGGQVTECKPGRAFGADSLTKTRAGDSARINSVLRALSREETRVELAMTPVSCQDCGQIDGPTPCDCGAV